MKLKAPNQIWWNSFNFRKFITAALYHVPIVIFFLHSNPWKTTENAENECVKRRKVIKICSHPCDKTPGKTVYETTTVALTSPSTFQSTQRPCVALQTVTVSTFCWKVKAHILYMLKNNGQRLPYSHRGMKNRTETWRSSVAVQCPMT